MPVRLRKICVMGFRSVGKSSLTIQFVDGQFVDSYDPTIENVFHKPISFNGQEYELKIVDTAGQDEYSIFSSVYAMDIHGFVIVYGLNNMKSFKVAEVIYDKLLDLTGQANLPIVLVGNKADLSLERTVEEHEIMTLAERMQVPHFEVTAKAKQEVDLVFSTLLGIIENQESKTIPHAEEAIEEPEFSKFSSSSADTKNRPQKEKKDKCLIN